MTFLFFQESRIFNSFFFMEGLLLLAGHRKAQIEEQLERLMDQSSILETTRGVAARLPVLG
jgi:hypothetical protein